MTQGDLESMFRFLKKAVIERAMKAQMSEHLSDESGESKPPSQPNRRNGVSGKSVITDEGPLRIDVPRGHFPSADAAIELLWLALRDITAGSVRPTREWKMAMNQFVVIYGDRFINPKN